MLSPKYFKTTKIGFLKRVANSLDVLLTSIMDGLKMVITSPVLALYAFCRTTEDVFDKEEYMKDLQAAFAVEQNSIEDEEPTIKHDHFHHLQGSDDDEEWKKAHRDEYGD